MVKLSAVDDIAEAGIKAGTKSGSKAGAKIASAKILKNIPSAKSVAYGAVGVAVAAETIAFVDPKSTVGQKVNDLNNNIKDEASNILDGVSDGVKGAFSGVVKTIAIVFACLMGSLLLGRLGFLVFKNIIKKSFQTSSQMLMPDSMMYQYSI